MKTALKWTFELEQAFLGDADRDDIAKIVKAIRREAYEDAAGVFRDGVGLREHVIERMRERLGDP